MGPRSAIATSYRAFLASRWPSRTQLLAVYAFCGTWVFIAVDWVFARGIDAQSGLGRVAALRVPWVLIPVAGFVLARLHPGARWFPAVIVAISVAWTWGNDWVWYALGLGGSVVQAAGVVVCFITAAIFMPLRPSGRVGVFVLMGAGHLALDLAWPDARPLAVRLSGSFAILAVVASVSVVFNQFSASQRRGYILRRRLERAVRKLEASRREATAAAAAVTELASRVAHDVNNPLAAVKVNVGWLGDGEADVVQGERAARTVALLRRKAGQGGEGAG
jgi:signal transduction histidine kinase